MKKIFFLAILISRISFVSAQKCDYNLDFSALNVGEIHNTVLLQLQNAKTQEERDNVILSQNFDFSIIGMTAKEFLYKAKELNAQLKIYDTNYNSIPPNILSDNLKPFIGKILFAINKYETLEEFNESLNVIQNEANQSLQCHELDAITAALKVAQSSSYFWTPKEEGGSGIGSQFYPKNIQGKLECCKWFKRMLYGDIMGAAGAVTAIGIGAVIGGVFTPGGNVVLLGGIGMSAAIGSVTGLIPGP